jgi:hypothetical protein
VVGGESIFPVPIASSIARVAAENQVVFSVRRLVESFKATLPRPLSSKTRIVASFDEVVTLSAIAGTGTSTTSAVGGVTVTGLSNDASTQ